jgi:hypothetical protein
MYMFQWFYPVIYTSYHFTYFSQMFSTIGFSSPIYYSPQEPFNAEPPRSALISSYLTPADLFYKRNHGPVPIVDDIEKWYVALVKLCFFDQCCSL